MGIALGHTDIAVAEDSLDAAQVDACLDRGRCPGVTQQVVVDRFCDPRSLCCCLEAFFDVGVRLWLAAAVFVADK